jgi:endonuclease G
MSGNPITERLRKAVGNIEAGDRQLSKELQKKRGDADVLEEAKNIGPVGNNEGPMLESMNTEIFTEAVVLRVGRPVLTIFHNDAKLEFTDAESEIWRERLMGASNILASVVPSVGRIEVMNHPVYDWAGTGWFVDDNIIVTNRHVAELFGRSLGSSFIFRQSPVGTAMGSAIDLLQEDQNPNKWIFSVRSILHIEPEPGPDIAFLLVDGSQGTPPEKLVLGNAALTADTNVAVIGYPAKDSRMPDVDLMEKIFGQVYNKKRLAPGKITKVESGRIFHDCSTLGGCSGGAVVDLATGQVAGLHFAGRFLESNYAIPVSVVEQCLHKAKGGSGSSSRTALRDTGTSSETSSISAIQQSNMQNNQYTFTIPLHITVSLGQPSAGGEPAAGTVSATPGNAVNTPASAEDEVITEGRAEDYDDREGYIENFLGEEFAVPLPEPATERRKNDLLKYDNRGEEDHVLRYEHFSVAMSKARRMCIYSACNIDGGTAKGGIQRAPWRLDPRIPKEAQIIKECYGSPPKFSRGHMTRREDPVWGSEMARMRGNADSMCVTNATPQMQSFNAPVWLALEDYALDNARDDKMKISVFTGPILKSTDPVKFGVKVPVEFWKVIAFIHDETGELCATGYKMSQKDHLPEEEFVFGEFDTAQVSIKKIERMTGLSFGNLSDFDPLSTDNEAFDGPDKPLASKTDIRFK